MKSYSPDKHREKYTLEEERFGTGFGMVDDVVPYRTHPGNRERVRRSSGSLAKFPSPPVLRAKPET